MDTFSALHRMKLMLNRYAFNSISYKIGCGFSRGRRDLTDVVLIHSRITHHALNFNERNFNKGMFR